MSGKVTVVIPFYNPGKYIITAIESVFDQTYEEWKMLLVNDASTDNSLSFITPYLGDPRVRLINNSVNIGQSKSLNVGLNHVETEFMIQLDADDWFYPHTLETMVREAKALPEDYAVVSGNITIYFEDSKGDVHKKRTKKGRGFKDKYDYMLSNMSVWPRFYRVSALRKVGGWPTDDPFEGRFNEDKRVLFYLIEHFRFYWIDKALYCHRLHGSNQTNDEASYRIITRWTVEDALKRWGDHYEAEFEEENGWIFVRSLKTK
ncbi:glycosyltransferase [Halobacillus litoralis]|uniref:glycosyltransferase family 2 protein n=1 Tax=Halobacillus litoralis TaxID=45668 RepID=UPI001CD62D2C|nr:glycosyltransferase family 2 protein [Halobacillus litoralis]MCA0970445.1 glycosyltransferase [Halobacillus litoralis]